MSFSRRRVVVAETEDASGVRVFVQGEDDEIDGDGTLEGVGDETTIEGPGVGTTRASRDVVERRGDVDDGDAGSALALGESSRFETFQNSIPGSGSAEFNLPGRFVAKARAEIGRQAFEKDVGWGVIARIGRVERRHDEFVARVVGTSLIPSREFEL